MQMRGCSPTQAQRLAEELVLYFDRKQPYNVGCTNRATAKAWWRLLNSGSDNPLVTLALLLLSMCPFASDPERVFSLRGVCKSQRPKRMDPQLLRQLHTVRVHLRSKGKIQDKLR
jgi:hypothetical protein